MAWLHSSIVLATLSDTYPRLFCKQDSQKHNSSKIHWEPLVSQLIRHVSFMRTCDHGIFRIFPKCVHIAYFPHNQSLSRFLYVGFMQICEQGLIRHILMTLKCYCQLHTTHATSTLYFTNQNFVVISILSYNPLQHTLTSSNKFILWLWPSESECSIVYLFCRVQIHSTCSTC